jgi:hypothetical protein
MISIQRDLLQTKALPALSGLAALLCIGWLVSNAIATDALRGVLLLAAVIAASVVAGKTLSDWRSGVYLFFVWLLFEDLIRKYMGNSMYVYFAKDLLLAVTYVSFVMDRLRGDSRPFRVPFKYAFGLFFLLGIVQFFNPGSPSPWYGVLGLKLYFYYVPLMFIGYGLMRSERDLHRFLTVTMGLATVVAFIGILQSIVGIEFLNPRSGRDIDELGHLVRYSPSGLAVTRPPSVFVSAGRFAEYLILVFVLGLGAAGYLLLRRQRGRKIVFPAVALVATAVMIAGGRGAFVYVVASAFVVPIGILWGAPRKVGEGYRLVKAIRRSFIFVAVALSLAVTIFPDVVGARWAFYRETISLDSPDSQAADRAWAYPANEFLKALSSREWLAGYGIGTASLGGQYVSRIMKATPTSWATESGYGNLVLELGILGPILWLLWTLNLMFSAGRIVLSLKGTWAFPVAFAIFWFAFLLLFPMTWGSLVSFEDFVLNAFLWFLIGVLFRLPALEAQSLQGRNLLRGPS